MYILFFLRRSEYFHFNQPFSPTPSHCSSKDEERVRASGHIFTGWIYNYQSVSDALKTWLMWPWRANMPTKKLLKLMQRKVLTTVWSWSLVKISRLKFCQGFWGNFILFSFKFEILMLEFGQDLWYDLKETTLVRALKPWVCCAFGNILTLNIIVTLLTDIAKWF